MKKVVLALAGLALGASVFAEGFKMSGDVKGGWFLTHEELFNGDTEAKTGGVHVTEYQKGDEFQADARFRLNLEWASEGDVAGAFVRFQGTPEYTSPSVKLAYAWLKAFEGKFLMQAGLNDDIYLKTGGYNDSSVRSGYGFFAGVAPIEGLVIGGGAQTDWLKDKSYDTNGDGLADLTESRIASKDGIYFGAKYTNKDVNNLSVAASYSLAGFLSAGVCIDPIEKLFVSVEFENKSDDFLDANGGASNVIYQRVEYTGVDNLTVGLNAKETINDRAVSATEDNTSIYIDPFARYEINETFGVSLEALITINSWDEDKVGKTDAAQIIIPAFYLKPCKGAEATVWAAISTDDDLVKHSFGTGVKFGF